jgi:SAM-dependent methyltransferase
LIQYINERVNRRLSGGHIAYYSKLIDGFIEEKGDHHFGAWKPEEYADVGEMQFEYLKSRGLSPSDIVLDFGAGKLRAGRYLIDYLNPGNYYGLDISQNALELGWEQLDENQQSKSPVLIQNTDCSLRCLRSGTVDFGIANSVWTHSPPSLVRETMESLQRVLAPDGEFTATYVTPEDTDSIIAHRLNPRMSYYTYDKLERWEISAGLSVEHAPGYPHKHQRALRITHG